MEETYLSSLKFTQYNPAIDKYAYKRQDYALTSAVLEQNYGIFKNSFNIGTGIGYYKGIQALHTSAVGLITNIGWFPIYKGKSITPYISYRNDWVFDKNGTNMQSICLSVDF